MIFSTVTTAATPVSSDLWQQLAPGLDMIKIESRVKSEFGDSIITVLRIDPANWELHCAGVSDTENLDLASVKDWAGKMGFNAAINAGMFATDYITHVGLMEYDGVVNNAHVSEYQSIAAFSPVKEGPPEFQMFDLDDPRVNLEEIRQQYGSVVQNLRLIKKPGENRWSKQNKRWSEAALGEDSQGRILFIFCRTPFTMPDLNEELLSCGIAIVSAQHLEGGPEAQLYVNVEGFEEEWVGSYETNFFENDENKTSLSVPNVFGIRARN